MAKHVVIGDSSARGNFCDGKQQYDKKGAITAAKEVHNRGRERLMRVYPCPNGQHWHIAHSDRWGNKERYRSK